MDFDEVLEIAVCFLRRLACWLRPVASETWEALIEDNLRFFCPSFFFEPVGSFRDRLPVLEARDEVETSLERFALEFEEMEQPVPEADTLDLIAPLDPLEDWDLTVSVSVGCKELEVERGLSTDLLR